MEAVCSFGRRFERFRIVAQSKLDLDVLLKGSSLLKHFAIEAHYEEGEHTLTIAHPHPTLHTLLLDSLTVTPTTLPQTSWASLVRLGVRLPAGTICEADVLLTLLNHCPRLERLIFGPISLTNLPLQSRSHATLQAISVIFDSFDEDAEENTHPMLILPSMTFLEVLPDFEWPLEDALTSYEEHEVATVGDPASAGVAGRTCTLRLSGADEFLGVFNPCWVTVTHLCMEVSSDIDVWRKILTWCPNLKELTTIGSPCTTQSASLCDPLTHDKLESLYIATKFELGNLLSAATFSVLQELTVCAGYYGEPEDVLDFLARSKCPLELLCISRGLSNAWTSAEKAELWRLLPSLDPQSLRI